jgi:CheY-like chemotaxis protein
MQMILVVEDDKATRDVLQQALEEETDWAVTTVADGNKLLEVLSTVAPSLILLDVNMPGIHGIGVYRLLREQEATQHVPVLFITSNPQAVRKAKLSGAFDCLEKPFEIDELRAKVATLLAHGYNPD